MQKRTMSQPRDHLDSAAAERLVSDVFVGFLCRLFIVLIQHRATQMICLCAVDAHADESVEPLGEALLRLARIKLAMNDKV